ncbi:MAG: ribosome biogenesis GTPase YlqF [Clostridia bacterium]|nr:ribosome biogenesis GTPase YlqF [Clostridia bacterium]
MEELKSIQWFPGHMTKTRRRIESQLKLIDAVAVLLDARIPYSSCNPDLRSIINNKPRLVVLNKCDMADPAQTKKWLSLFRQKNIAVIALDCKTGKGLNAFIPTVKSVLSDRIKSWEAKGMTGRTIKVMIVGIPNVGKSSFINRMSKQNRAKVEDRPGVTRGNQWFTIGKGFDLLDTPGVLWPKFDDPSVGEKLAFIGSVKDDILDTEQLSGRLLEYLRDHYPDPLCARYKLTKAEIEQIQGYEILEMIGRKRGMLISGGEINTERAAATVLDEFRSASLGKLTIDKAEDYPDVRI